MERRNEEMFSSGQCRLQTKKNDRKVLYRYGIDEPLETPSTSSFYGVVEAEPPITRMLNE